MNNKGLLNDISRADSESFIWDLVDGNLIKIPVKMRSHSLKRNQIEFEVKSSHLPTLNEIVTGSGHIKFFNPNQKVAFESDLISIKNNFISVNIPHKIKRFERRETPRFEPLFPVKFEIAGRKFDCADVSLGGFSILIGTLELPFLKWKDGQEFEGTMFFTLNKSKVKASIVKIQHIPPYKNEQFLYGAYRISFMFSKKYASINAEIEKIAISMNKLISDLK